MTIEYCEFCFTVRSAGTLRMGDEASRSCLQCAREAVRTGLPGSFEPL